MLQMPTGRLKSTPGDASIERNLALLMNIPSKKPGLLFSKSNVFAVVVLGR